MKIASADYYRLAETGPRLRAMMYSSSVHGILVVIRSTLNSPRWEVYLAPPAKS